MSHYDTIELERLQAHDPGAIEGLLVEYSPIVYNYFLRMGLQPSVAEDLAQETFRRVWLALQKFQGNSTLKTWILSIGRRVAFHHFKREKSRPDRVGLSDSLDRLMDWFDPNQPVLNPEQAFLQAERQYTLQTMLETLPSEEREVVVLHGLEELSQREVADLMGRSLGWVNKTWQSACKRVKRKLLHMYRESSASDFFAEDLVRWHPQMAHMTRM